MEIGALLLLLIIILVLFLLFRAIVLWYWKVNTIVSLLTQIRDTLQGKRTETSETQPSEVKIDVNDPEIKKCANCQFLISPILGESFRCGKTNIKVKLADSCGSFKINDNFKGSPNIPK